MPVATWSDAEPDVEIASVEELRSFVDECEARCDVPVAESINCHDYRVDFLVGHAMGFVQLSPAKESDPCLITVGDLSQGVVAYWFQTNHHGEVPVRHLVPKPDAWAALVAFFDTEEPADCVRWEAV